MTIFLSLLALFYLFAHSDASRCFDCRNVSSPLDCAKVRICNSDEYCFTEQIVTANGNIVYNTGCLSKSRCSTISGLLVGKRSANITERRSTDISICLECCTGNNCNNQGCGTKVAPLGQRGPYCFNCHSVLDPKTCSEVAMCAVNEKCLLYSPAEFSGLPEAVYRSQCENKAACQVLSQTVRNYKCPPTCCDTDFCNDQCGTQSSANMTTQLPYTQSPAQTTHQQPVVVTNQGATYPANILSPTHHSSTFHCNTHGGYKRLHAEDAHLCVHIVTHRTDWESARKACKQEDGDLVVLDTTSKAALMRSKVNGHLYSSQTGYWIGAKDFSDNNHFSWVNGREPVTHGDWYPGQPNHHHGGHDQNCACMWGIGGHFQWHDVNCQQSHGYICERNYTN